jgi:predicted Zn-dependent protease
VALFLLISSNAAFGGKKAPKLNETVDLPQTFEVDFQFAAKQRAQLGSQREVPDDIAGRVGEEVFESLVKTQMISGFHLPYTWTFTLYDTSAVNAGSLSDGEVEAYTGLSRLIGTNRGLWAAVLGHEIAHVARRHAVRKALFHEYVEQQVRYWQMRARLGDKGAGWTALAVRVAGNLAEKKLSRDLEHDADIQGMLLMARAGYHPDNAFAMHHLLRMNTPERSRVGTFFLF